MIKKTPLPAKWDLNDPKCLKFLAEQLHCLSQNEDMKGLEQATMRVGWRAEIMAIKRQIF